MTLFLAFTVSTLLTAATTASFTIPTRQKNVIPIRLRRCRSLRFSCSSRLSMAFTSEVFQTQEIRCAGTTETAVKGGRDLFPLLPKAFDGISAIGFIGWGSQSPSQSQNVRDSLKEAGSDIRVAVGLREGSSSFAKAREAGFCEEDGTLGEMFDIIRQSDLVVLLISDGAQTKLYKEVIAAMKPGATLGLSHGFLLGHLDSIGDKFPEDLNVIAVCPKGLGPSVRRLYLMSKDVDGAGINSSFAVHQDVNGKSLERAIGWGVAIGSPFIFETTLRNEYRSDIFGERGILFAALQGIIETLYRRYQRQGMTPQNAFIQTKESITGRIVKLMSTDGIKGVYDHLSRDDKETFKAAYSVSYKPIKEVMQEVYDEVSTGNEIRSVVMHSARLDKYPVGRIDGTEIWKTETKVRDSRRERDHDDNKNIPLNAFTAGVFVAGTMAQVDVLLESGHPYSEIVNESVIEATDSLCPYLHFRGLSFMVDNCSTTARLGARKWSPRYDYILDQQAFTAVDSDMKIDEELFTSFLNHPVHDAVTEYYKFRPPVDVSVFADNKGTKEETQEVLVQA